MRRRSWWAVLLAVLLALSAFSGAASAAGRGDAAKVHPFLAELERRTPNLKVEVIVQMVKGARLSDAVLGQGVTRTREFPSIGAHVLELPVRAAVQLSRRPDVRHISYNSPLLLASGPVPVVYPQAIGVVDSFWADPAGANGHGVGIAVLDSGIANHPDLPATERPAISTLPYSAGDTVGHGTHVAGIIAGRSADGRYTGVAPGARLIDVKMANDQGQVREDDLIAAMEWVFHNQAQYNIRVANISATASVPSSYLNSPVAAAAELLWFHGVTVVVAAGNRADAADAVYYAPANDPFVITVGAFSDNGTADRADDYVPTWSSRGLTQEGVVKPELTAPGHRIVSTLAGGSLLSQEMADRIQDNQYLRLSGTSMATPVVSGLAGVILSKRPDLTPSQVKWLLVNQGATGAGGMVDARAIYQYLGENQLVPSVTTTQPPSHFLNPAAGGISYDNLLWENLLWENLLWENLLWENLLWENLLWENLLWENLLWENLLWENLLWENLLWEMATQD